MLCKRSSSIVQEEGVNTSEKESLSIYNINMARDYQSRSRLQHRQRAATAAAATSTTAVDAFLTRPRRNDRLHAAATIVSIIICLAQLVQQPMLVHATAAASPALTTLPDVSPSTEFSVTGQTSSVTSSITASVGGGALVGSTKHFVPVTQAPSKTVHKRTGNAAGAAATGGVTHARTNNKQKLITINDLRNHSREALSHEGSQRDSVVYLSDNSGYIPVTSLRGGGRPGGGQPPPAIASVPYHSSGGPASSGGDGDLEAWRTDLWDRDYTARRHRHNSTRVQHIEAECQDDYMKIRVGFNGSFSGLLYSAGYAYDPDCMYINGSGRDYYEFFIQLNRCGTLGKNAIHDKSRENPTNFMWNTITVQYNPLIEEEFDEHFKVTCEYGYDFWKTVTFPFLDVEVATGNPVVFTLSPPECYMEIRNGYGIAGNRVTGPVRVGDPLTLIIYMRSKYDGFDIVVNDCYAHNGATKRIQLIDEYGCPVDDKLISRFRGSWSDTGVYETQVYAYMKTFRFTGSPALYIECDVRMCHGNCPSQPCHWRNLKSISKRDVSNQTIELDAAQQQEAKDAKDAAAQSDNISLFQSLRVLQEGEEEAGDHDAAEVFKVKEPNETCVKTAVLSTITAGSSVMLGVLLVSLMLTCSKLRNRKKDASIYDAYVNHKGQID